jgi:MarR family transcriptional regulator, 2-MHQ and catechol-resistance regulon repressor
MSESSSTAEALKLWVVLSRAYSSVAAHAAAHARRHGLTPAEFGVLELLHHRGDTLIGEIRRRILVSSGGVTYLIDRLEERDLVERKRCPDDRRATYVGLTPSGAAHIAGIFPEHAAVVEAAVQGLGDADRRRATDLLRTLGHHAAASPSPADVTPAPMLRRGRRRRSTPEMVPRGAA